MLSPSNARDEGQSEEKKAGIYRNRWAIDKRELFEQRVTAA